MTAELLSCWFDYSGSLRRSARAPAGLPCFFFVLVGLFSLAGVSPARACPTPASAPCDPHGSLAVSPFVLLLGSFQSITRSVKKGQHEITFGSLFDPRRNLSCLTGWRKVLDHVLKEILHPPH